MGDTLTLDFDASLQPGTYTFENFLDNYSTSMYVFYDVPSDPPVTYKSIAGTLTLTAVGLTISGSFQVTAADSVNPVNTVVITGSFTDLPGRLTRLRKLSILIKVPCLVELPTGAVPGVG
jgi:hypothetical protein